MRFSEARSGAGAEGRYHDFNNATSYLAAPAENVVDMFVLPTQQDFKNGKKVIGETVYLSENLGDSGIVDKAVVDLSHTDALTGYSVYKVTGSEEDF